MSTNRWHAASGCLGILLIVVPADAAVAAELMRSSKGAAQNTYRLLRQPTQEAPQAQDRKPADPDTTLTLGVAYEDGPASDHAVTTPFAAGYSWRDAYFEVSGDGHARQRADDARHSGPADVSLLANYTFKFGKQDRQSLTPEFELVLPTHGNVGSRRASQIGRLAWSVERGDWTGTLTGGLAHDGEADPGVSRTSRLGKARLGYSWDKDTSAFVEFKRAVQRGDTGRTEVHAEFDFPIFVQIVDNVRRAWTGAVNLGWGGSAGQRSRSIEFDLSYAF